MYRAGRTRLPRQIIRPPDPGRSTSTGTRVYIASSLLANWCATSGLGNLVPALGRAVPAHRMRTASQLRENSQGSPWYAACSIWAVMESALFGTYGVIPLIMGHEIAGEVAQVGSEVRGFAPGDRGVVNFYVTCGRPHRGLLAMLVLAPHLDDHLRARALGAHLPGHSVHVKAAPRVDRLSELKTAPIHPTLSR